MLEAIRAACGPLGCLVLVMNYTGDRLNFGMAVERAKAEGYKVSSIGLLKCLFEKDIYTQKCHTRWFPLRFTWLLRSKSDLRGLGDWAVSRRTLCLFGFARWERCVCV